MILYRMSGPFSETLNHILEIFLKFLRFPAESDEISSEYRYPIWELSHIFMHWLDMNNGLFA